MIRNKDENTKLLKRLDIEISFLEQLIDYCTKKKMKKGVSDFRNWAVFVLSNDLKEIGISVSNLYKTNSNIGYDSLNRVAFEKFLYLNNILKSELRAKAFFLKMQIRQIEHTDKIINNEEYQNAFSNLISTDISHVLKHAKSIMNDNEKKERILDEYLSCFTYEIPDSQIYYHKWYNDDSKTNKIMYLAKKMNLQDEYIVLYDLWSSEVHSTSLNGKYGFIDIDEKHYFAEFNDKSEDNNINGIVTITLTLYRVIQLIFSEYNISRTLKNEFHDIMKETIDYRALLRKSK